MSYDLTGDIAVVTGGTRGIDRAITEQLAASGVTIVANYYSNEEDARETEELLAEYDADSRVIHNPTERRETPCDRLVGRSQSRFHPVRSPVFVRSHHAGTSYTQDRLAASETVR